MSKERDEVRLRRIRILQGLFAKTKENGASEEESASAIAHAQKLMGDWAIEDHELGEGFDKKTFIARDLELKYANKWRWELANKLAWNTGVYAVHSRLGKREWITFRGRESHVEAAAMLAEFIINAIEVLSSDFAKKDGSGSTGRRRFARGCSIRVGQRIDRSYNLTSDARLPVLMKEARNEAKEDYQNETGEEVKNKNGRDADETSREFYAGFRRGDDVKLRPETEQIVSG